MKEKKNLTPNHKLPFASLKTHSHTSHHHWLTSHIIQISSEPTRDEWNWAHDRVVLHAHDEENYVGLVPFSFPGHMVIEMFVHYFVCRGWMCLLKPHGAKNTEQKSNVGIFFLCFFHVIARAGVALCPVPVLNYMHKTNKPSNEWTELRFVGSTMIVRFVCVCCLYSTVSCHWATSANIMCAFHYLWTFILNRRLTSHQWTGGYGSA